MGETMHPGDHRLARRLPRGASIVEPLADLAVQRLDDATAGRLEGGRGQGEGGLGPLAGGPDGQLIEQAGDQRREGDAGIVGEGADQTAGGHVGAHGVKGVVDALGLGFRRIDLGRPVDGSGSDAPRGGGRLIVGLVLDFRFHGREAPDFDPGA